jgi:hypothetical protein
MLIAPVALDNLDLQVFSLSFLLQQDTNFEIHQHNTHLGILENLKNHRKSNNKPNKKKKLRDLWHPPLWFGFLLCLDFVYFCFWLEFSLLSCFYNNIFSLFFFCWKFLFFLVL